MLARADSLAILELTSAAPAALPAWARAANAPEIDAEAAFLAGAALSRLDIIVRDNPPWAGVFRRRLAFSAAAASVLRAGRAEDEARLRDALDLARPGADPGRRGSVCSPGGNCPPARWGIGVRLSTPPPRSWGSRATRPCKRRSTPPRPAPSAAGRRRSPRRGCSPWRGAPGPKAPGVRRSAAGEGRASCVALHLNVRRRIQCFQMLRFAVKLRLCS